MQIPTHQQIVADLDPQAREELLARSNETGLKHLAGHLAILIVCGIWIVQAFPLWQGALIAYSIAFIFLFSLLHETVHDTPFASRWLNRIVGMLCGFVLLLPAKWFGYFHLAHHRFTQDKERDPELVDPKPKTWIAYAKHLSGLPAWKSQIETMIGNVLGTHDDLFVPSGAKRAVRLEARIHLMLYAGVAAVWIHPGWPALLWLWVIPALIGQPFLRAYLLAEHTGCPFVSNMLENTRTTYTNKIIRFLAWNMPYHTEHHTYPSVPFHQLPHLNQLIGEHVQVTESGYLAFYKTQMMQPDRS